jgi:N-acetylmuramoyl-L-alanine amidase
MRQVNKIIVHCTATPEGRDVSVDTIRNWHIEDNGWSDIGYHWVITLGGEIEKGRHETKPGAHAKGHNANSIGVVYVGGCDKDMNPKDTRNDAQKESLRCLLEDLRERYPQAVIIGHRDVSSKACPSFDAKNEYSSI